MAGTLLPTQAVRSLMKKSSLLPSEAGGYDVRNVTLGVFESAEALLTAEYSVSIKRYERYKRVVKDDSGRRTKRNMVRTVLRCVVLSDSSARE